MHDIVLGEILSYDKQKRVKFSILHRPTGISLNGMF